MATTKTAKAPKTKKAKAPKTATGERALRWSIGLFRNQHGKLVSAYVDKAGSPMAYEQERVGAKKALFHDVYTGMKYSEARQALLKAAAKDGIKSEPKAESESKPKAAKKAAKKAPAAKAPKAAKAGKKSAARKSAAPAVEVTAQAAE